MYRLFALFSSKYIIQHFATPSHSTLTASVPVSIHFRVLLERTTNASGNSPLRHFTSKGMKVLEISMRMCVLVEIVICAYCV